MSQFRFTGPKDDAIAEDGDRGFLGINQRDTLNQLKAGEVRVSQNGRMDGFWKPRKATNLKGAALTSPGTPLTLPFTLDDGGTPPKLNDTASSNIYGSCLFSDGNSSNLNSILIAMNTKVVKVDLTTYAATDINLPTGQNISSDCHMLQCFDKVVLMRPGQAPLEWDGKTGSSFTKSPCGAIVQPFSMTGCAMTVANGVATVIGGDIELTGSGVVTKGSPNDSMVLPALDNYGKPFSAIDDFYVGCDIKVSTFNYKPILSYVAATRTVTFLSVVGSSATLGFIIGDPGSTSGNPSGVHNLIPGDEVLISDAHTANAVLTGTRYFVSEIVNAYTFKFYINYSDVTIAKGTNVGVNIGKLQSLGAGFIANPGAPWGFYFQRRLWVPYWYKPSGSYLSPVYTDRGTRNEIVVSDILDNNTFDTIYAEFKIGGGTADFTVGFHGFYEDTLVVFNRNSIHKITGTRGALTDATVEEITGEIGCMARKSIVMHGNQMLFLSDSGVFGLEFVDLYNLRNGQRPISLLIQPYIDRINVKLASNAVACYFDNRYWLAVPLDSTAGANDAIGNNSILIYNFLNQGWESVDTYQNDKFNIIDFHVGINSTKSSLYVVTNNGGIHKLNDADSVNDLLSVDFKGSGATSTPIDSVITTRGYDMKDMGRKRFTDVQIEMQSLSSDGNSSLDVLFATEDPDQASLVGNTQDFIGEALVSSNNANVRARLGGVRGYNGSVTLKRKVGSPKVISVKVAGSLTNRSIISQH
jgi:hypothetical protein